MMSYSLEDFIILLGGCGFHNSSTSTPGTFHSTHFCIYSDCHKSQSWFLLPDNLTFRFHSFVMSFILQTLCLPVLLISSSRILSQIFTEYCLFSFLLYSSPLLWHPDKFRFYLSLPYDKKLKKWNFLLILSLPILVLKTTLWNPHFMQDKFRVIYHGLLHLSFGYVFQFHFHTLSYALLKFLSEYSKCFDSPMHLFIIFFVGRISFPF